MVKNDEFKVHLLSEDGVRKAQNVASMFDALLNELNQPEMCQTGREFSICKTKLEEACFYAKKSLAMNKQNQKGE